MAKPPQLCASHVITFPSKLAVNANIVNFFIQKCNLMYQTITLSLSGALLKIIDSYKDFFYFLFGKTLQIPPKLPCDLNNPSRIFDLSLWPLKLSICFVSPLSVCFYHQTFFKFPKYPCILNKKYIYNKNIKLWVFW